MKVTRQWWNDGRYERECQAEQLYVWPTETIRAVTENGLELRVKLHIQFPMHCGVAYL